MKKVIIFLVCIMPLACFAITVYDIKYSFPDNKFVNYEAFLVRYDQNGGFIRVKFTDNRNNSVSLVNMEFTEEFHTDKLYLIFKCNNPKYLKGTGQYNPDYFWFRKNDNDGKYYSYGINSPGSDGKLMDGTILSMNLLDVGVLTKEYVLNFFASNEPFYKNLFAEAPALATNFTEAPKFHLILVANTNDESIGYGCQYSQVKELERFRYIANVTGMTFFPTVVDGINFNKSSLLTAVDNVKPGKNDVVVFYYNGHGFRYKSDTGPYPRLDLTTKGVQLTEYSSIALSDVYDKIKAKNARLSLVISDCCNSADPPQLVYGGAVTAASANTLSQANCKQLFLFSKGNIIAAAASKGQFSLYDSSPGTGGIFSTAFLSSLDYHLSTFSANPSWNDILSQTKNQTSLSSSFARCPLANCKYVPVFDIEQPTNFTNNFIRTSTKTTASVNKLWIEYDVLENNVKGMRIHVNFTIYNYKDRKGYCSAYFYNSDGTPLKDYNKVYSTSAGNVSAWNTFVPIYDNTSFNDYALFIPYSELHRSKGYYELKLYVEIHSSDGTKFNSLAISGYQYFTFTQP